MFKQPYYNHRKKTKKIRIFKAIIKILLNAIILAKKITDTVLAPAELTGQHREDHINVSIQSAKPPSF